MPDKIGDPLANAAQSGVLGRRPSLTTKPIEQAPEKKDEARVKKTLLFSPQRAKWLKIRAAQEERDMSDIAEDALAMYQQLHPDP